jgi:hypothetical protein
MRLGMVDHPVSFVSGCLPGEAGSPISGSLQQDSLYARSMFREKQKGDSFHNMKQNFKNLTPAQRITIVRATIC